MNRNDETTTLAKQAFWTILGEGKVPTVDLVNDWFLTSGHSKRNRNAISSALKSCWDELGARVKQTRTIPDIPVETVNLVVALRDNMLALAAAQFEEERQAIIANADERTAQARADADRGVAALKDAESKIADLSARLHQATAESEELSNRIVQAQQLEKQQQEQIVGLQDAVANATAQGERDRIALATATREHAAALASEAARYTQMQHDLQQKIDDERTRAARLLKQIEKQENTITALRDEATKRERLLSEQNRDLSSEVGKLQGMRTVLQEQLTQAHGDAEKRIAALNAATERIATLAAESAPLATQIEEAFIAGAKAYEAAKTGKKGLAGGAEALSASASAYAVKVSGKK